MTDAPTHPWAHLDEAEKQAIAVQLRERLARAGIATNRADSPLDLAQRHEREFRVRPHVTAMNEHLTWLEQTPDARLMIFSPPQVGKSRFAGQILPEWWLTGHPRDRIVGASYGLGLATKNGVAVRDWMIEHGHEYGLHPSGEWNRERWTLTTGGGMKSVGIGGRLTGESMDLGIIDDPHKDRAEAKSKTRRDTVWEWYSAVFGTRRQPGTRELLVMCMTGDTPVLRPDGTETPLRDIRPGDEVATYEGGALTTATVQNWANQGPDSVYRIRMRSGREVRANARHPFLTIQEGEEVWARTDTLRRGSVILTATGASGAASPALPTAATATRSARDSACPTTTSSDGRTASATPPNEAVHGDRSSSASDTGSTTTTTTACLPIRTEGALSAGDSPTNASSRSTGTDTFASTTATTRGKSGGCCATTATSASGDCSTPPSISVPPLSTWTITRDEVLEVVLDGYEDVFDVQIDRTENFIANGLVSHNTRWHPDDLAGRLLAEYGRIEEGGAWRVLHMPALALATDLDRGIYPDPLGREPGEPLSHPKIKDGDTRALAKYWAGEKANRISADWDAMYLTIPFASDGALLTDDDMKNAIIERAPEPIRSIVSVDPSGEGRDEAGIVAGQLDAADRVTITHDATGQYTVIGWSERVCKLAHEVDADGIVVEKNFGGAMGRVIVQQAWENLQREGDIPSDQLCPAIYEVHARKSKVLRAEPVAQAIKTGRVKFLRGTNSESGHRHLRLLRTQWTMWTPGSTYSPGALDACVHLARFLLPPIPQGAGVVSLAGRSRADMARPEGLRIPR